ncbi:MAG: transposase, partial [Chloroflexota bacterium]
MLGVKQRVFKTHLTLSLEKLVPPKNFYRQVQSKLDLDFVRELVAEHYSGLGRPSIDPVVFFKLHLIMFFEDIRSERYPLEMINLRLDHRWYLGYDLDEVAPDHSSLTKIRDRYGVEVIQAFISNPIMATSGVGFSRRNAIILLDTGILYFHILDSRFAPDRLLARKPRGNDFHPTNWPLDRHALTFFVGLFNSEFP